MRNYIYPLLVSTLLGGTVFFLSPDAGKVTLGFVDLERVLTEHPGMRESGAKLEAEFSAAEEGFQKRRAALAQVESELAIMDTTNPQYRTEMFRLEEAFKTLDRERQFTLGEINSKAFDLTLRALEQIEGIVARVGEEQGLDAVHVLPTRLPGPEVSLEARVQAFQAKKTLWTRSECDITNQVLAVLQSD